MNSKFFGFSIIGVLVLSTLVLDDVFARADLSVCGIFDFNNDCDLSSFAHLILGDMIIGGFFGFLFFLFTERNNRAIQAIVRRDFEQANRRKDYAVRNLKSTINILLFTMGLMKKLTTLYNLDDYVTTKEELHSKIILRSTEFDHFLDAVRNGLFYSADVLEPNMIYKIEQTCLYLSQLKITFDDGALYINYESGKERLQFLFRVLYTYRNSTHTFGFIDENEEFAILKD